MNISFTKGGWATSLLFANHQKDFLQMHISVKTLKDAQEFAE